ncbi:MAG: divalent metal cation transporter [Hyphomicrobiales bacterium]|nr:divalent metal cation transporter [Hyphomicrobiales bacterium]
MSEALLPEARAETSSVKQPPTPKLLQILGPGLITGASDDDPSGIATYSQTGAQYGYQLGWILLFTWPLMCAIQEISARVGRVTGNGLAGVIKRHYSKPVLYSLVSLLLLANTINIGADLGAMAAAVNLLVGGPTLLYVAAFAVISVLLEVFVRYSRYVSVLKWLTLSLFAYVGTAFVVDVPWGTVGYSLVHPKITLDVAFLTVVVAVLGTTISPYLFFWQASEEVEEIEESDGARPLRRAPEQAEPEFHRIRVDTYIGMALSNAVALFIVITTAATLNAHGVTDIQTSSQAAEALRPIAGPLVFLVFALGIIGTGLLALPVLAGSAAYALGETFGWRVGLARRPGRAIEFYATIALATGIGAILNFTPIDPFKALFWSAVINGIAAAPLMALIMHLACRRASMGRFTLPLPLKVVGWLATAVMGVAALGMLATMGV